MYASGGGLGSCACPGFDEHCSTRHKSKHPCSLRPSEDLKDKDKIYFFFAIYNRLHEFDSWRSGLTSPTVSEPEESKPSATSL